MNLRKAQGVATQALERGKVLYFYKANNGQWMADGTKGYSRGPYYTVEEFLAKFCGVRKQ